MVANAPKHPGTFAHTDGEQLKVVAITGVNGGIGRATARVFHNAGWIVIGIDRRAEDIAPEVHHFIHADIGSNDAPHAVIEEIDRWESEADRVMRAAMSKLFREEDDVKTLIKLKAIYELLEEITDKCEDVANIIEGIVLENA